MCLAKTSNEDHVDMFVVSISVQLWVGGFRLMIRFLLLSALFPSTTGTVDSYCFIFYNLNHYVYAQWYFIIKQCSIIRGCYRVLQIYPSQKRRFIHICAVLLNCFLMFPFIVFVYALVLWFFSVNALYLYDWVHQ